MNNWYGFILTSVLTIIGGVTIFCFSQLALKLIIEPIVELNKCRGEICHLLILKRNLYLNPSTLTLSEGETLELSKDIRKLGAKLLSIKTTLRCNKFFSKLNFSIKEENILEAHKSLIGLSNAIQQNPLSSDERKIIYRHEDDIKKALNI